MVSDALPTPSLVTWLRRAWWLALITIAYNLLEGLVSMAFGAAEESVALFGFGVDSFIEVGSAVLVLWRLRGESGAGTLLPLERERRATLGIGVLLLLLALGTAVASTLQLASLRHPATTTPGVVISLVSLSFMWALYRAKRRVARVLDSATLAQDAACSLACIQLSGVLLVGSALYALSPALWWADAAAALALSILIGREGAGAVRTARSPHFAGGCGCGGACHDTATEPGPAQGDACGRHAGSAEETTGASAGPVAGCTCHLDGEVQGSGPAASSTAHAEASDRCGGEGCSCGSRD